MNSSTDLRQDLVHLQDWWALYEAGTQRLGFALAASAVGALAGSQAQQRIDRELTGLAEASERIREQEADIPERWGDTDAVRRMLPNVPSIGTLEGQDGVRAAVRLLVKPAARSSASATQLALGANVRWSSPVPRWATALEATSQRQLAALGLQSVGSSGVRKKFDGSETGIDEVVKLGQAYAHVLSVGPDDVAETIGRQPNSPAGLVLWASAGMRLLQARDIYNGVPDGALLGARGDAVPGRDRSPLGMLKLATATLRGADATLERLESFGVMGESPSVIATPESPSPAAITVFHRDVRTSLALPAVAIRPATVERAPAALMRGRTAGTKGVSFPAR